VPLTKNKKFKEQRSPGKMDLVFHCRSKMNCFPTISSSKLDRNWRLSEAALAKSKKLKRRKVWRRRWN